MSRLMAKNEKGEAVEIKGTLERLTGCAGIIEPRMEDGELAWDWDGGTEVYWDGAETAEEDTPDGKKTIFLGVDGEEYTDVYIDENDEEDEG